MREDRTGGGQWEVESNISNPPVLFKDVWLSSATQEVMSVAEGVGVGEMMEADKINNNKLNYGGLPVMLMTESVEVLEGDKHLMEVESPGDVNGVVVSLMEVEAVSSVVSTGFNILEEAGIFLEDEVNECLKQEEEEVKMAPGAEAKITVVNGKNPNMETEEVELELNGQHGTCKLNQEIKVEYAEMKRTHPDLLNSALPFNKCRIVLTSDDSEYSDGEATGSGEKRLGWHSDGEDLVFYDSVREEDRQKVIDGILEDDEKGTLVILSKAAKATKRMAPEPRGNDGGSKKLKLGSPVPQLEKVEETKEDEVIRAGSTVMGDDELDNLSEFLGVEDDATSSVSSYSSIVSLFRPIKKKGEQDPKPRFRCEVCLRTFMNQKNFEIHKRLHSLGREQPFTCQKCGDGFIAASYLECHQTYTECKSESEPKNSNCPSTSTSTNSNSERQLAPTEAKQHVGVKELKIILDRLPLEMYPRSYRNPQTLNNSTMDYEELKIIKNEKIEKTTEASAIRKRKQLSYLCPYCHTSFGNASELIGHLPLHDSIGPEVTPPTPSSKGPKTEGRRRKQVARTENDVITGGPEDKSDRGMNLRKSKRIPANTQVQLPLRFEMSSANQRERKVSGVGHHYEKKISAKRPTRLLAQVRPSRNLVRRESQKNCKGLPVMSEEAQNESEEELLTAQKNAIHDKDDPSYVHERQPLHKKITKKMPFQEKRSLAQKVNRAVKSESDVMEKLFECSICGKQFSLGENLKSHVDRLHSGKNDWKQPYPCRICGRGFRLNSVLQNHIRVVHKKIKKEEIGSPRRDKAKSTSISTLTNRQPKSTEIVKPRQGVQKKRLKHGGGSSKPQSAEKMYKCNNCSKTYGSVGGMHYHLKVTHPDVNAARTGYSVFERKERPIRDGTVTHLELTMRHYEVNLVRCDYLLPLHGCPNDT